MSKEEIIKQEYEKVFASQKYDNSVNREMNLLYFLPAMDEYAKSEAIAFGDFLFNLIHDGINEDSKEPFTTSQAYDLYLKSKV